MVTQRRRLTYVRVFVKLILLISYSITNYYLNILVKPFIDKFLCINPSFCKRGQGGVIDMYNFYYLHSPDQQRFALRYRRIKLRWLFLANIVG
jgi:hypothetical protein